MPTDIINNNTVIDVNHSDPAFLINHAGIGNDLINSVRINAPNRNGQIVRAVPIGSTRTSCIDPVVFAHVIENDNDFANLNANRRHIFRTTVIDIDTNLATPAGGPVQWFDTGINLVAGEWYYINTTGIVDVCGVFPQCPIVNGNGTGGPVGNVWPDCCDVMANYSHMAIIGRIVNPANGVVLNGPFRVGATYRNSAAVAGRLQIRHNDWTFDNSGSFHAIIRSVDVPMPTNQFAFDFRPGQGLQKYQFDGLNWLPVAGENIFTEFGANQYIYDQVSKTTYYTRDMKTLLTIGQQIDGLTNNYINVDLTLDNITRFTLTSPNGSRWILTNNTRRGNTTMVATPVNNTF